MGPISNVNIWWGSVYAIHKQTKQAIQRCCILLTLGIVFAEESNDHDRIIHSLADNSHSPFWLISSTSFVVDTDQSRRIDSTPNIR